MKICSDLDGVICKDPCDEITVPELEAWYPKAQPLNTHVHYHIIATGRPERARKATEKWLKDNGVSYGLLLMTPEGGSSYKLKSGVIASSNECDVYIESSPSQAVLLSYLGKGLVFCIQTRQFHWASGQNLTQEIKEICNSLVYGRERRL